MRLDVPVILLVAVIVSLAPPGAAQPCEVPGRQLLPTALCAVSSPPDLVNDPEGPGSGVHCLRAPA